MQGCPKRYKSRPLGYRDRKDWVEARVVYLDPPRTTGICFEPRYFSNLAAIFLTPSSTLSPSASILPISVTLSFEISIQYSGLTKGPTFPKNLLRQHGPFSCPAFLEILLAAYSQGYPTNTTQPSVPSLIKALSLGSSDIIIMVDCNLLRDPNKLLVVEKNRVLLESKSLNYSIEILYANKMMNKTAKSDPQYTIKKIPIVAVYGLMQLEVDRYLIVVTKAFVIGQIYHRLIYQVDKVEFVPLSQQANPTDKPIIEGLMTLFNEKQFYYSDDYDLTNSLQKFIEGGCSMNKRNEQFFYNSMWIEEFYRIGAAEWVTGFISGLIVINFCTLNGYTCELVILSRRDKRRQGARWICRGSNLDGNTANTAETEQMFFAEKNGMESIFSFVQARGSMPFKWESKPNLKWSPDCNIFGNDRINSDLCRKHIDDMKKSYENVCMVNLIDKKGSKKQRMLGNQFQKLIATIADPSIKFIWFDFHSECKNLKYENLSKLVDMLSRELSNYGYYHIEKKSGAREIVKKNSQKGILRTNCMDCLDRTNVVQSVFGRNILHQILEKLGIENKGKQVSAFERLPDKLEEDFRVSWTKNADLISMLYSGTPAMKTDFTLMGKRTVKGALTDLFYGIKRYFLGNFYDWHKQDIIDVSIGRLKPKKERIRKPLINIMFILLLIMIAIPFLTSHIVQSHMGHPVIVQSTLDQNNFNTTPGASNRVYRTAAGQPHAPLPQLQLPPNLGWYKVGATVAALFLFVKVVQVASKSILEKPTMQD